MIRILHAARVESRKGKTLDLGLLLNQIGGICKNLVDKVAQRSLAPVQKRDKVSEDSDSNDDTQPKYGHVAIVAKPQTKHFSPSTINAMVVGMTHHYHALWK
jgi:hypothetical protein